MNFGRFEYLAMALGGLSSIVVLLWALDGLNHSELVLETKKQSYCFGGYVKYVLCFSIIAFVPSLLYTAYFGRSILRAKKSKSIPIGARSVFLVCTFVFSGASILVCLGIGSLSCA